MFDHLKSLLVDAPLLVYPDFTKNFVLETDASGSGLRVVLVQKQENGLVALIAFCKQDITEAQAGLWSNITRSFRSGMGN